jgi:hypothetical protein
LLVAALGCAVAWGIIDGVMYVATSMFQRGQEHRLIMTIRNAASRGHRRCGCGDADSASAVTFQFQSGVGHPPFESSGLCDAVRNGLPVGTLRWRHPLEDMGLPCC